MMVSCIWVCIIYCFVLNIFNFCIICKYSGICQYGWLKFVLIWKIFYGEVWGWCWIKCWCIMILLTCTMNSSEKWIGRCIWYNVLLCYCNVPHSSVNVSYTRSRMRLNIIIRGVMSYYYYHHVDIAIQVIHSTIIIHPCTSPIVPL